MTIVYRMGLSGVEWISCVTYANETEFEPNFLRFIEECGPPKLTEVVDDIYERRPCPILWTVSKLELHCISGRIALHKAFAWW